MNVHLDSYRLAQYAVAISCRLCGGDNTKDAEQCEHCFAPMALTNDALERKAMPNLFPVLGSVGAGKTVYLGMLMELLSRKYRGWNMLERGAFSITVQQQTMSALSRSLFPEKTPSEPDRWNWVHLDVHQPGKKRSTDVVIPDLAGEAIMEEVEHPETFPAIRALLKNCSGAMVLIDSVDVEQGNSDQDFAAMKMMTYLGELYSQERKRKRAPALSLIFTKADECPFAMENPSSFARQHMPGIWKHCEDRFSSFRFFATGVAGACTYRNERGNGLLRVPLRIEPHGILEPFAWLVETTKK